MSLLGMPTTLRRERVTPRRALRRSPSRHRHLTRVTHDGHTSTFAISRRAYENLIEDLEALSSPRYLASIRRADRDIAAGGVHTLAEVKRKFGIR